MSAGQLVPCGRGGGGDRKQLRDSWGWKGEKGALEDQTGGEMREADRSVFWLCRMMLEGQKQATERHRAHAAGHEVWSFGYTGLTLGSSLRSPVLWRWP